MRFLYNGQYGVQTEENGLYYMRARYYSQDVRRFVNLDSVRGELTNTQSLNRYIFVEGNPVSATDPLGLSPEEYLYYKEGNYPMMLASIAGTVANPCGTGGAVAQGLAKSGKYIFKSNKYLK